MKIQSALAIAAVALLAAGRAGTSFESFINRLEKAPEGERDTIVTEYLQTAEVPVVEGTSAWFVYRDAAASNVSVAGDFNDWKAGRDTHPMLTD